MSVLTAAQQRIWYEAYRPQTINDIILPDRIKNMYNSKESIPNSLFFGSSGTGKTTLSNIIRQSYDCLWINASLNNDIDTVRHEIDTYCSTMSLDGPGIKLVVMDECDALSKQAQQGLRGTIEKYEMTTRFVFTCNYVDKVIPAIRSRLKDVNFDFSDKDEILSQTTGYITRLISIATANGMTIDRDAVTYLIKRGFPDLRSMIMTLEGIHKSGVKQVTAKHVQYSEAGEHTGVFEFIRTNASPTAQYTMLSAYKAKEHVIFDAISRQFLAHIAKIPEQRDKLGECAVIIHKYTYESKNAVDQFVTLLALVYSLSITLNKK